MGMESYRAPDITPLITLDESKQLYLLELFCGPTFAFKDVALQFLGNLFEYFLVRTNKVRSLYGTCVRTRRANTTSVL
jgi:threonine synthase